MTKSNLLTTISIIVITTIILIIVVVITVKLILKQKTNVVDLINNVSDEVNYKIY